MDGLFNLADKRFPPTPGTAQKNKLKKQKRFFS